jgi:hypothetical protein
MLHLLEAFRPDHIWLFGSETHRDLYARVAAAITAKAETRNNDDDDVAHADELVRILDWVRDEYSDRSRDPRLNVKRLQPGMPLLTVASEPQIQVTAMGASSGQVLIYESTLSRCFTAKGGFLADNVPNVNHNLISGGLLIEYGQARILLGGDIEVEAWKETLRDPLFKDRMHSQLVKVSHHGSETGYCPGLWEHLSPERQTIAVLTPFCSQGLPSAEGLAHIASNAGLVLTPSTRAAHLALDWAHVASATSSKGLSADALLALRSVFPRASPRSDRMEGACSFHVHADGTVTHEETGNGGLIVPR